ncbi:MAG: hypothetical protein ACRCYP_07200, partial [Alphaproteobacteria bacterium]
MTITCFDLPAQDQMCIIRQSFVTMCEGNVCAAALLNFFTYWHCRKKTDSSGESLAGENQVVQRHTQKQLQAGLMGIFSKNQIVVASKYLQEKGLVEATQKKEKAQGTDRANRFVLCENELNLRLSQIGHPLSQSGQ